MVPIICGWEYFPQRRGLISGIVVGGFGFGSFIFGFVAQALVNPDNVKADIPVTGGNIFDSDTEIVHNVPRMLRVLVIIWAVLSLIGILLVRKRKPRAAVGERDATPFLNGSDT